MTNWETRTKLLTDFDFLECNDGRIISNNKNSEFVIHTGNMYERNTIWEFNR